MWMLWVCTYNRANIHAEIDIEFSSAIQVAACSLILLAIAGCLQHQDLEFLHVNIENNGILTVYNECYKATIR